MSETRTAGRIETIAKAIAAELPGWTAVPWTDNAGREGHGWWDLIRTPSRTTPKTDADFPQCWDNQRLSIRRQQNNPGRITITGAPPAGWTTLYLTGESRRALLAKATAGVDRDPAAIARDIERKIFPVYLPKLAEVVARLAENRSDADKRKAAQEALASEYGGAVRDNRWYPPTEHVSSIELNYDGTAGRIDTQWSIPINKIRAVLDVLSDRTTTADWLTEAKAAERGEGPGGVYRVTGPNSIATPGTGTVPPS